LNKDLINKLGRVGCIVPSGIATDDTTKYFFQDILENNRLVSIFEFENDGFFLGAGSGHMVRFVLLTMTSKDGWLPDSLFMFQGHKIEDLRDEEKVFTLSSEDIALINPNTKTCPIFQTKRDAEITKDIYRRVPVLINENDKENGNPWGIKFMRMFDMSNDSGLFRTREQLESEGWVLNGNIFEKGDEKYLPLFEAKMIYHYNHRYGDFAGSPPGKRPHILPNVSQEKLKDPNYCVMPYYWIPEEECESRISKSSWKQNWFFAFRDVTDSRASARTVIASIVPLYAISHPLPIIMPSVKPDGVLMMLAIMSSFIFDFVARQKVSGLHLTYNHLKQLPFIFNISKNTSYDATAPQIEKIEKNILELVYTSFEMKPFAESCGYSGPPFYWNEECRFQLKCELDGIFFHLYNLERDDVEYIMETFPIVKRKDEARWGSYRTKEEILKYYDEIKTFGDE
jgi:hypothetical protein